LLLDDRNERSKRRRDLSNHVVTRVYRPPEIILTEAHYGPKLDLWSLGCILVELIQCSDEYNTSSKANHNRYLFKGTSCYPLSPQLDESKVDYQEGVPMEETDLLRLILNVLGEQNSKDLSFITKKHYKNHVRRNNPNLPKIKFDQEFKKSSTDIPKIIESLLEFNPEFRQSAGELLKLPIFDSIRRQSREVPASVKLEFDYDRAGVFDYENFEYSDNNSESLARLLHSEISNFREHQP